MESDKRISKRTTFESGIRYQQKGSQTINSTIAKNISNSGIGFISSEFIPKSSQLVFELNPPGYREYMKVAGEVVWISNQPFSERYYIGAKFVESPAEV